MAHTFLLHPLFSTVSPDSESPVDGVLSGQDELTPHIIDIEVD